MPDVHVHTGTSGGAEAARCGFVAVVVDALRASGTISTLLAHGVACLMVVAEPDEALALRDALIFSADVSPADILAVGERGGLKVPGFDRGNEPIVAAESLPPVCIFTSSNCARCCLAAREAPALLLGTTINASAVIGAATALAADLSADIMLIPAGFAEDETRLNLEDTLACGCMIDVGNLSPANDAARAALYAYRYVTRAGLAREMPEGVHGRHLVSLGRAADIAYLAQVDVLSAVPVRAAVGEKCGVTYVELRSLPATVQPTSSTIAATNTSVCTPNDARTP
jgi:2-phosphosulfolactate phosphatase